MNISVIGTGYVELITAAGLSEKGHNVTCVDIQKQRVELINSGKTPLFEEGLEEILKKNIGRNLKATTDLENSIFATDVTFICVQTPADFDGTMDLSHIKNAAIDIGKILRKKGSYHVVVVKSTVPPSTTEEILAPLLEKNSGKISGS